MLRTACNADAPQAARQKLARADKKLAQQALQYMPDQPVKLQKYRCVLLRGWDGVWWIALPVIKGYHPCLFCIRPPVTPVSWP